MRRRRKKNLLLQRVEYALYRAVASWARTASGPAIARWGTRLGALAGLVLRSRGRLALRNLQATFPDRSASELRGILAGCWRHFGRTALASIRMQEKSPQEIADEVFIVNFHEVEEAMGLGRGVLFLSAHFGSWEIGGLALTTRLRDVRTVARPLDNEFLERDLAALRERTGAQMVDRKRAARSLLRALQEGSMVILLPDQAVQPKEGALVPFLGRPAWTTTAPAKMALRSGSTIVFGFCIPDGLRHRLEFEEPIRVDELSEAERDPVALTKRINDVIGRHVRERPELYLWMHDRWKGTGESAVTNG